MKTVSLNDFEGRCNNIPCPFCGEKTQGAYYSECSECGELELLYFYCYSCKKKELPYEHFGREASEVYGVDRVVKK